MWPKLFGSPSCQSNLKIEIGSLSPKAFSVYVPAGPDLSTKDGIVHMVSGLCLCLGLFLVLGGLV